MAAIAHKRKLQIPMSLGAEVVQAKETMLKGDLPSCRWISVTPELAMKWLENSNFQNRTVRQDYVKRMANDMRAGRWMGRNGEAVRFDTNNRLVDGQHRMWACVESGVPFETLVVYDIAPESYATIGIGAKKSLADFMFGEKNVHLLASAVRLVYLWQNQALTANQSKDGRLLPTVAELEITLENHAKLRESVNTVAAMNGLKRLFNLSYASLIHYAGTLEGKHATVTAFLDRLQTGVGLEADDPIYQFRKFLLSQQSNVPGHRRAGKEYILALAIKAWNMSKDGQKTQRLKFMINEEFPQL